MTDEAFDAHVAATETRADGSVGGLDYCLLKLSAEAGEVAGLRGKEILVHGCPPDIDGKPIGKEPLAELHIAAAAIASVTAETKPVECMAVQSYAEGCPLVCGTPTTCGRGGCARAQRDPNARDADGYAKCWFCGQLTRHSARVPAGVLAPITHPVCKAPACRKECVP